MNSMSAAAQAKMAEMVIEQQLAKAATVLEETVDNELARLDTLDEDDIENIRRRRIAQMKDRVNAKEKWMMAGHGVYSELSDEKSFFDASKASPSGLVCHFYRESTFRCKIVDKHLSILAPRHIECRIVKLNAEKSPFLTARLGVHVLPTMILVKDEQIVDRIVGFDDLGGTDDFDTEMLEWRLARHGVLEYAGDLTVPPSAKGKSKGDGSDYFTTSMPRDPRQRRVQKNIRGGNDDDSDDE